MGDYTLPMDVMEIHFTALNEQITWCFLGVSCFAVIRVIQLFSFAGTCRSSDLSSILTLDADDS